ncbi:MAG: alpha/beta hydrolase [Bryobacteraceae bacterium]|nr:alpha/beta hydrolase [Bryobacteraceae bacterium]
MDTHQHLSAFKRGERQSEFATSLLDRGYALVQSGYSRGGIAVDESVHDSNELRRYFRNKYPQTEAVYVLGESMGGLIALRLVEQFPRAYTAGLSFCGMLSTPYNYVRRVFDLLTLFAYFHTDMLPAPAAVPSDFRPTEDRIRSVARALEADPDGTAVLRSESGANDIPELAAILVFHTDLLRDVRAKCGGNPIGNAGTLYVVGADLEKVNAGVARVSAAPGVAACLKKIGGPQATLARPFLAVDASRDPVVPGWFANAYQDRLAGSPSEAWFVRQYLGAKGHCSISLGARVEVFQELVQWSKDQLSKPRPGLRLR